MAHETKCLPLAWAEAAANWVIHALEIPREECLVGGSIRRRVPEVKDIELIVPMPEEGQVDKLLETIRAKVIIDGWHGVEQTEKIPQAGLMGGPASTIKRKHTPAVPAEPIGVAIKGAKPEFRYCKIQVESPKQPGVWVGVDIFRYVPGPQGNRGWIELIRTGPQDFGIKACQRWKTLNPGACSNEGFLCRSDGVAVPCPTEKDAFTLLEWPWIEPHNRQ